MYSCYREVNCQRHTIVLKKVTCTYTHNLFTANPIGVDGTIELRTGDPSSYFPFPLTNRVGYENVTQVSHQYSVSHFGDLNTVYQVPLVLWLKDGLPVPVMPTSIPGINGRLITTLSFLFTEDDAGVYQVIFTDTLRSELFLTDPIRLETGECTHLMPVDVIVTPTTIYNYTGEVLTTKAVSPPITILRPPETLMLEIRSSGRYDSIQWQRKGEVINNPDSYTHFFEVYFSEDTTTADLGTYEVNALVLPSTSQVAPNVLTFLVIQFGKYIIIIIIILFCA